ncbi:MAG: endolytic transglycosylase MltG [Oligoflexales bacterium]|nr:endolytic transglycosylase MltG [Oligoflexales bacterium]
MLLEKKSRIRCDILLLVYDGPNSIKVIHLSNVKRLKLLLISLLALASLGVLASFSGLYYLKNWSQKEHLSHDSSVLLKVPKGVRLGDLAASLQEKGLIDDAWTFKLWVRSQGNFKNIQAGQYAFEGAASPDQIMDKLISGQTYEPVVLEYTIPEGFTLTQVLERLARLGVGTLESLEKLSKNKSFIRSLGIEANSLEGFIYPATYRYHHEKPSEKEAFERMTKEFFARLPKDYIERCEQLGITLYKAMIIASLIEKETMLEEEKPLVSEVIWNRLKKRMPLGIDASIIYGIKNFDGNLTFRHLKDKKNPYNSRVRRGLPPSPIGALSLSSLLAVLNPANEGNYFYVLLPGGENRHHFSKTLQEHNRYVKKLVKAQRKRR